MDTKSIPAGVRRLVILSLVFLIASMIIAGTNAYITFAAPERAAYVPSTVGFEGQLADASGSPVADGSYTITFSLYAVATEGTALWSETQSVAVQDGLYSVQLGTTTPLGADDFDGDRWLGVQVDGDSEMAPRIQIGAVPFAFNASQAEQAGGLQGYDVSISAPQDGDILIYDATADEWSPGQMAGSSLDAVPTGTILAWAGDTPPAGFLLCNGEYLSRTLYADLFAVIGTTYGAGDGSTSFNIPDLRGRTIIGLDNMGDRNANVIAGTWADTLGGTAGEENHALTIGELPSHTHTQDSRTMLSTSGGNHNFEYVGSMANPAGGTTQATGGNQPHNNIQPSMAVNYIIKY